MESYLNVYSLCCRIVHSKTPSSYIHYWFLFLLFLCFQKKISFNSLIIRIKFTPGALDWLALGIFAQSIIIKPLTWTIYNDEKNSCHFILFIFVYSFISIFLLNTSNDHVMYLVKRCLFRVTYSIQERMFFRFIYSIHVQLHICKACKLLW